MNLPPTGVSPFSRRRFLKSLSVFAAAATGMLGFSALESCKKADDNGPAAPTATGQKVTLVLANESSLAAVGGFVRRTFGSNNNGSDVLVIRVAQGGSNAFETMSVVCTHAGCAINNPSGGQAQCPCHGSVFGASASNFAANLAGPAPSPLPTFPTTFDGKNITIQF